MPARPFIPLTPVAFDRSRCRAEALPRVSLVPSGTGASGARPQKKPYTRRQPGNEQLIRQSVQLGFLVLNAWIGALFYLWVRYYETGGQSLYVTRPPGVEGYLPIASLMNLKALVLTGEMPSTHAAGLFLIVAFMAISLLFRKAFCSWLCPIGTISEWLWQGGQALFGGTLRVWRPLDILLRSLKYVLLALFLYAVWSMPPEAIRAFLESPYGVIADVKMLNFFRALSTTAAVTLAVLLLLSVVVKHAWCRYLCPYGALMGLLALLGPTRIRRDAATCIDCAKCAKACPAGLPVDRLPSVRSAECAACLLCVSACPAAGALDLALPRRRVLPAWGLAAAVIAIFVGVAGAARATGYWHTEVPDAILFDYIPRAHQFGHPGR